MTLGTHTWPPRFEQALADARPRLVRIARLNGLAPHAADDAAQETLIIVWRQHTALRQPDRFDAWLDGICRNICLHQRRSLAREAARMEPISQHDVLPLVSAPESLTGEAAEDPLAELERDDLHFLLDQALAYLPDEARALVGACYLAETPQREVAARMGITLSALEARLHRVRRELRRVLGGELRPQAEAAGLLFEDDPPLGWRETRLWCMFCGQRRMQGVFETLPSGALELRMRCQVCCRPNEAFINTGSAVEFRGSRAFGPAFKRMIQTINGYYAAALAQGGRNRCHVCGHQIQVTVVPIAELFRATTPTIREHFSMSYTCPRCRATSDAFAIAALYMHPAMQGFIARHPRWKIEPERAVECDGMPAIRFGLADVASTARLTMFAARATLRVLATYSE